MGSHYAWGPDKMRATEETVGVLRERCMNCILVNGGGGTQRKSEFGATEVVAPNEAIVYQLKR